MNTDKVDTEIPAPASGTVLKIVAEEGVPARVGAVLAFIGKPGESVEGSAATVSTARVESKVESQKSVAVQPETSNLQPSTYFQITESPPVEQYRLQLLLPPYPIVVLA